MTMGTAEVDSLAVKTAIEGERIDWKIGLSLARFIKAE